MVCGWHLAGREVAGRPAHGLAAWRGGQQVSCWQSRAATRDLSGSLFSGPSFYFFFLLRHGLLVHFLCVAHNRFCFSTNLSTWAEEKAATWQQRQPSE